MCQLNYTIHRKKFYSPYVHAKVAIGRYHVMLDSGKYKLKSTLIIHEKKFIVVKFTDFNYGGLHAS